MKTGSEWWYWGGGGENGECSVGTEFQFADDEKCSGNGWWP